MWISHMETDKMFIYVNELANSNDGVLMALELSNWPVTIGARFENVDKRFCAVYTRSCVVQKLSCHMIDIFQIWAEN